MDFAIFLEQLVGVWPGGDAFGFVAVGFSGCYFVERLHRC